MHKDNINFTLNPINLRKVLDLSYNYVKFNSSEEIVNKLITKFNLTDTFNIIIEQIDRPIVYGIKNKQNKLVVEIYLYYTDRQRGADILEYLEDALLLLSILNTSIETSSIRERFVETSLDKAINIVSFDIDENGRIDETYINLYSSEDIVYKYNLHDNSILNVGTFQTVDSINLKDFLNCKSCIKCEYIPAIIVDLLDLCPNLQDVSDVIIFHEKSYNNSVGIYLPPVNYTILKYFLSKYFNDLLNHATLSNDDGIFNDILFSVHLDYDLSTGNINSCGFFDYF
jgi:hypothetical protein